MGRISSGVAGPARNWTHTALAAALALTLNGCDSSSSPTPTPPPAPTPAAPTPTPTVGATGCLSLDSDGEIRCVTDTGWRIVVGHGSVTVRPPNSLELVYSSTGTSEQLGEEEFGTWGGNRRTLILPGGAKVTMRAVGTDLVRVSIYDGDESHEIDAVAREIRHSQVDAGVAASRDEAELDGEAGHLGAFQLTINPSGHFLYLANIYSQTGSDGTAQPKIDLIQPIGRQEASGEIVYGPLTYSFPNESPTVCGTTPVGGLTKNGDGTVSYVSRSGEYSVLINGHTITITRGNPGVQKWEVWGDPHENLNGKHIKDWETTRRTVVLSDGTKITMDAQGPQGTVESTSIYDGPRSHRITNDGNVVTHSCVDAGVAAQRDGAEADGEAGYVTVLRTAISPIGSLIALNYYNETVGPGGTLVRSYIFRLLGETGEPEVNPNQVVDYYDDPRLGHT